MWDKYVLDVTFGTKHGLCFCPYEEDGTIVTGMNIISDTPPGTLIGVFHSDGVGATNKWVEENQDIISRLMPNVELTGGARQRVRVE